MILYQAIYILCLTCIFIVNIKNYKKLKQEYEGKFEEHVIFSVVFVLLFFEIIIFTAIFLIAKLIAENL